MRINVNLDDVKEYVEEGWYPVRVAGGEVRTANDGNSQYINWKLEIFGTDSDDDGRNIYFNTSLKPTALPMMKRFLEAAGFEWDDDGFNVEDVMSYELEVQLEGEEYEGKMQNNVRNYRPY